MALVTIEDVEKLFGEITDPIQKARATLDLEAITEVLEGWLRRKFEPVTIYDEEHFVSGAGVFLHWGDPIDPPLVKYGNPWAEGQAWDRGQTLRRGETAYITYTPDPRPVQNYEKTIKRMITSAVIAGLMKKDAVRYRVISNYSVEGLSVSYVDSRANSGSQDVGDIAVVDLAALKPLRRNVVL